MKKYFIYISIIITAYFYGCDKPGPTELVDDETFDVEILGKDLDNEFYSNGYDTSGVVQTNYDYASLISVSGIKISANGTTTNISSAVTYIFDKTTPIYSPGGHLLGFKSITPGRVFFNGIKAIARNVRIRYKESGNLIDTSLGTKYELFKNHRRSWGDTLTFDYNSTINFTYSPLIGPNSSFQIQTPQEVNGIVKLLSVNERKYKAELTWNGDSANNFYIVIGGVKISNQKVFPFYKIKTRDDGKLNIPKSLLDNIDGNQFNKITVSFVRQYAKIVQGISNDIYVSSQSIHTVIVDMP